MIELLAPAGDLQKLKVAIDYGADACYIGGELFGLRTASASFTIDNIKEALEYAHSRGKKVYLVLNIIPHNEDIEQLKQYLEEIKGLPIDGFIVSDPGTLKLIRESLGYVEIHLSTQANTTSAASAAFWADQGVKRIILARELNLEEISHIVKTVPELDFEVFVHGAMCMSYSGRCLISSFLTGRDANRGDCAQSCRWRYHLVEEKRPGEYFPIEETEQGTAIMSSKDLAALPILDQVIQTGVKSLKLEGRNKSIFYVASIVRIYREAIDRIERGEYHYEDLYDEMLKVSHRDYSTGFFMGHPDQAQNYGDKGYIRDYQFVGRVLDYDDTTGRALIEQRNHFKLGDEMEAFGPDYRLVRFQVNDIMSTQGQAQESAPHPMQQLWLTMPKVESGDLIRRPSSN